MSTPVVAAPFEKKPQYPLLVNFTAVAETGAPDEVRRRARLSIKTKISRSLFGGTGGESLLAEDLPRRRCHRLRGNHGLGGKR